MSGPLCDVCRERAATVFVTKIINNQTSKQRLCETCARQRAAGEGWMQHLMDATGAGGDLPLDEIVMNLFEQAEVAMSEERRDQDEAPCSTSAAHVPFSAGNYPPDEDDAEGEDEAGPDHSPPEQDLFGAAPSRAVASTRCSKCAMTWDRLRQDGRVGCAHCYVVFAEQLRQVLERVQRGVEHTGKHPRAAQKRRRRVEHLRSRRDHRLDMLNRRLKQAVTTERYEEAAKVRDKIRMVASTIVSNEG